MNQIFLRQNYKSTGGGYQLLLPMDVGLLIPADDSVRLLNSVLERVDYRELHAACETNGQTEILLLAMAFNLNKLHSKARSDRLGEHLHELKAA